MNPLIPTRIETSRLILRTWEPADRPAFAEINTDQDVMEHLEGRPLTRAESDAILDRSERSWEERGYSWYALADRESAELLGFCGLSHHRAIPAEVEVGWRLARHAWGRGLATEAALVCRDLAFDVLGRDRLISITVEANARSWRVMHKLGMRPWQSMPFEQWELWIWAMTADDRTGDAVEPSS
ncbi:MAG TPA: GNAT family N-acetyltransferase [Jiangellaceae bacterium]|nr:GNAT family N-acetyltransferase [Jiangellaceae bacterium]